MLTFKFGPEAQGYLPANGPHEPCVVTPTGYYVALLPLREEKTKSGIILPESEATKEVRWGKVLAVGDGEPTPAGMVKIPLTPGDVVCYQWNRGVKVMVRGTWVHLINYREIMFRVNDLDGEPARGIA